MTTQNRQKSNAKKKDPSLGSLSTAFLHVVSLAIFNVCSIKIFKLLFYKKNQDKRKDTVTKVTIICENHVFFVFFGGSTKFIFKMTTN